MNLENRKAGEREDRPAPETDAECFVNEGDFVTGDFARRLERERDEWKSLAELIAADVAHNFGAEVGKHLTPKRGAELLDAYRDRLTKSSSATEDNNSGAAS